MSYMFPGNTSVIHQFEENVAPGLIGAAAAVEVAVTVPGAAVGDLAVFAPRQANATGIVFSASRVSAANTVQLRFCNPTAGGLTPPATDDYDIYVFKGTGPTL